MRDSNTWCHSIVIPKPWTINQIICLFDHLSCVISLFCRPTDSLKHLPNPNTATPLFMQCTSKEATLRCSDRRRSSRKPFSEQEHFFLRALRIQQSIDKIQTLYYPKINLCIRKKMDDVGFNRWSSVKGRRFLEWKFNHFELDQYDTLFRRFARQHGLQQLLGVVIRDRYKPLGMTP